MIYRKALDEGIEKYLEGSSSEAGESKVQLASRQESMREELRELYKYRELLYMIAYRDIKVRYKQSIMGFMWAVLMPILIVMSGIVVRYAYALAAHVAAQDGGYRQRGSEVAPLGISGFQHSVCLSQPHQQQGTGN